MLKSVVLVNFVLGLSIVLNDFYFKTNGFIPTCHYCRRPGHIRPRCFKYIKAIKQERIPKPISTKCFKRTPKSKVEVQKTKKVWIRKSDLSVASTSSKACVAKNMIGEKEMTCRCSHQCSH